MESLKQLRKRIKSIKETWHITHAMKLISASRLRNAENSFFCEEPFLKEAIKILRQLLTSDIAFSHPLLEKREVKKVLFIILTSDRGLCGSFNHTINQFALNYLRHLENLREKGVVQEIFLHFIGRKGMLFFRRFPTFKLQGSTQNLKGKISPVESDRLASKITDTFLTGEVDEVYLIYSKLKTRLSTEPQILKLLPVSPGSIPEPEESLKKVSDFIIDNSPSELVDEVLKTYISTSFHATLQEHFICEHNARLLSMANATKSCEDLNNELTLRRNRLRQSAITAELIDIIDGAEAQK